MRLKCPYCGLRDHSEFSSGGESLRSRPESPGLTSDAEWAEYQFYRENPKGLHFERWVHIFGCRQWFNVVRDTVTHEIVEVCRIGVPPKTSLPGTGDISG
jgi:heterotetrameric sarcosine oxidase delta subunit